MRKNKLKHETSRFSLNINIINIMYIIYSFVLALRVFDVRLTYIFIYFITSYNTFSVTCGCIMRMIRILGGAGKTQAQIFGYLYCYFQFKGNTSVYLPV